MSFTLVNNLKILIESKAPEKSRLITSVVSPFPGARVQSS